MKISTAEAEVVFRTEAEAVARSSPIDSEWLTKIRLLSQLCVDGGASTHIAFFGTSLLAKAVNASVDLKTVKPEQFPENSQAYSARVLSEKVLVPLAAEYGVHIGSTGRQPLNNQPYFRIAAIGDSTPIHTNSQPAFQYMVRLIDELQATSTSDIARLALRAFIFVRRSYQPKYALATGELTIDAISLSKRIQTLVATASEGGKRAQAAAAGIMDVFAGRERVESGRINDPSRHYPGDVCIRAAASSGCEWEKAIEVRDKPVMEHDIQIFCGKCLASGTHEAVVLMVSGGQQALRDDQLTRWASSQGLGLTLFYGWQAYVEQALFWAGLPRLQAAQLATSRIEARLISVEASTDAVLLWQDLVRQ